MTFFIKLDNGTPTGHPITRSNLVALLPDVEFPSVVLPNWVEQYGYGIYEFSQIPEITERYKKAIETDPIKVNGIYKQTWGIVDMDDQEKQAADQQQAERVRIERDARLYQTDWTQLADSPLTPEQKQAYASYRQQLRDITTSSGFPWEIEWPIEPN